MNEYIYTDEQVSKAIKKLFSEEQVNEIQEMLNLYGDQSGKGKQRVRLAVLKLSQGNKERLLYFLNVAIADFRDVLLWAEYDKDRTEIPKPYRDLFQD